jgi:hypothetical protein
MELVSSQPECAGAIMAISKSTNQNILAFILKGDSMMDYKWIHVHDNKVTNVTELSSVDRMFVDIQLLQDGPNVRIKFSLPVAEDKELFLMKVGPSFAIVFEDKSHGLCQLREIFLQVEESKAYCRCKALNVGYEFMETIDVNLGPLASFF